MVANNPLLAFFKLREQYSIIKLLGSGGNQSSYRTYAVAPFCLIKEQFSVR